MIYGIFENFDILIEGILTTSGLGTKTLWLLSVHCDRREVNIVARKVIEYVGRNRNCLWNLGTLYNFMILILMYTNQRGYVCKFVQA